MSDDTPVLPYPPLPPSAYLGSKYATPDEKQLAKRIVDRFLDEARIGNVYEARAGFCGARTVFGLQSFRICVAWG